MHTHTYLYIYTYIWNIYVYIPLQKLYCEFSPTSCVVETTSGRNEWMNKMQPVRQSAETASAIGQMTITEKLKKEIEEEEEAKTHNKQTTLVIGILSNSKNWKFFIIFCFLSIFGIFFFINFHALRSLMAFNGNWQKFNLAVTVKCLFGLSSANSVMCTLSCSLNYFLFFLTFDICMYKLLYV